MYACIFVWRTPSYKSVKCQSNFKGINEKGFFCDINFCWKLNAAGDLSAHASTKHERPFCTLVCWSQWLCIRVAGARPAVHIMYPGGHVARAHSQWRLGREKTTRTIKSLTSAGETWLRSELRRDATHVNYVSWPQPRTTYPAVIFCLTWQYRCLSFWLDFISIIINISPSLCLSVCILCLGIFVFMPMFWL